tara:strand:+ start:1387 stop:2565 length:1179 start_codon:yes stop_codon:yes gene_type:complete
MNSLNSTIPFANNLYFLTLSVLVLMLFVYVRRISIITSSFSKIVLFLAVLFILYILKQWSIHLLFIFSTSIRIFLAYLAIRLLNRDGFFYYLKELVYYGALISIPFYFIQLIDFNFIFDFITLIQNSIPPLERDFESFSNIIFWGIRLDSEYRNSGFMWEPGAFAAMLLFPIYIQLQINNFKIDRKLIILIIALLTTLSTMGYFALVILLLYYQLNSGKKFSILFFPVLLTISFFILQQDFVFDKLLFEIDQQDEIENYVYSTNNEVASLGRIGSFTHDFREWKADPIIGIGGDDVVYQGQIGTVINRTNGLSRFLLQFGLVGIFIYFSGIYRSFYYTTEYNKRITGLMAVALLLVLSFSNELLAKPLFLGFALIYLVAPTKKVLNFKPFTF